MRAKKVGARFFALFGVIHRGSEQFVLTHLHFLFLCDFFEAKNGGVVVLDMFKEHADGNPFEIIAENTFEFSAEFVRSFFRYFEDVFK